MADFIIQGSRTQALDLSGTNIRLSSPPSSKNSCEDDTRGQKLYLAGEVGENCLIQV